MAGGGIAKEINASDVDGFLETFHPTTSVARVRYDLVVELLDDVNFFGIYTMLRTHLQLFDGVRVADLKCDPSVPPDPAWAQTEVQRIIDTHIESPIVWALQQLQNMSDAMNRVANVRVEHTRGRLIDYERLTRIDQRIGRELQRALAEYRLLQERDLGDESPPFDETNPPTDDE